jgi:hypothetical protein
MLNERNTQLRRLTELELVPGDLIPVVDKNSPTSPTGETKYITALDLANYIIENDLINLSTGDRGLQTANGLSFDEGHIAITNNDRCYGGMINLGRTYSLFVKGYISPDMANVTNDLRVLFGVGDSPSMANSSNSAYIGIQLNGGVNDLVVYVQGSVVITYPGYFSNSSVNYRAFYLGLTKDLSGLVTLYINGEAYASAAAPTTPINSSYVTMGNGRTNDYNVKTVIYEGHVYNYALNANQVDDLFYRGVDTNDTGLVASYNSVTLNAGPSQWLDSIGSNHLLLPTTGALATGPSKRFVLSFYAAASGYLGDGSVRDILPERYVLTSCVLESSGKPLVSIGSSPTPSYPGSSGTGSFWDNRVSIVSASYGVNPLKLVPLGIAHKDRTIYVEFYSGAAPCSITFDGYIRDSYDL